MVAPTGDHPGQHPTPPRAILGAVRAPMHTHALRLSDGTRATRVKKASPLPRAVDGCYNPRRAPGMFDARGRRCRRRRPDPPSMPRDRRAGRGRRTARRGRARTRPLTPQLTGVLEAARGMHQAGQHTRRGAALRGAARGAPRSTPSRCMPSASSPTRRRPQRGGRRADPACRDRRRAVVRRTSTATSARCSARAASVTGPRSTAIERALDLAPGAADFTRNLGRALLQAESLGRGRATRSRGAVRLDPRHVDAWCELGLAHDALGDESTRPIACERRALALDAAPPQRGEQSRDHAPAPRPRPRPRRSRRRWRLYRTLLEAEPDARGELEQPRRAPQAARRFSTGPASASSQAVRHEPAHAQAIENLVRIRRPRSGGPR